MSFSHFQKDYGLICWTNAKNSSNLWRVEQKKMKLTSLELSSLWKNKLFMRGLLKRWHVFLSALFLLTGVRFFHLFVYFYSFFFVNFMNHGLWALVKFCQILDYFSINYFDDILKKGPEPKWIINKLESNKNKKFLSVDHFGILYVIWRSTVRAKAHFSLYWAFYVSYSVFFWPYVAFFGHTIRPSSVPIRLLFGLFFGSI